MRRKLSNVSEYIKVSPKLHKLYLGMPKIGTVIKNYDKIIRTDEKNRLILCLPSGEMICNQELIIRLIYGYEAQVKLDNGTVVKQRVVGKGESGLKLNKELLKKKTQIVNNIPIMNWVEIEPSEELLNTVYWTQFVPVDMCFDALGETTNKFTRAGIFIVCNSHYGGPNFDTKRFINGSAFDLMYHRTRAFDKIPRSVEQDFQPVKPKSLLDASYDIGASITFRKYTENMLNEFQKYGYQNRGYKMDDHGEIDTKFFMFNEYGITGKIILSRNRELNCILRLNSGKILNNKSKFSAAGFESIKSFINNTIEIVQKSKHIDKSINNYVDKVKKHFDALVNELIKLDKKHKINYMSYKYNEDSNVIKKKEFECYNMSNSQYFTGKVIGGIVSLEKRDDEYCFVLTIIGDGITNNIEYKLPCTREGLYKFILIYKDVLLK